MQLYGQRFHKPIRAVFLIQPVCQHHDPGGQSATDTQSEELTHAAHIQDDDDQECPDKSPGTDEKVLASQSFKFDGRIHALMDFECCHILIRCAEK